MRVRRLLATLVALAWLLAGAAQAARIVAVGDIHGEIDGFDSVLRAARLIDADGRWAGGNAILVQTGDVTDRGAQVRAVMDRLRSLDQQAPAEGGRVVALLGNHEISNLIHLFDEQSTPADVYRQIWSDFAGDDAERRQRAAHKQWRRWQLRYPGCVQQENRQWIDNRTAWLDDHPLGFVEYIEALSPAGEYGRWLRGLGVAADVGGTIFLHGGISPDLVERGYTSIAAINEAVEQALQQFDEDRQRLIDEQVILPFSSLWETHCAVFVEMARLEKEGQAKALARRDELAELNQRLPGMASWLPTNVEGPLWYRGLATADEAELGPQLDEILTLFDAERIAVGHTPEPGKIRSRLGGKVYLLDTAMAYSELGGSAAALEIDGDLVTAIYPDRRVTMSEPLGDGAIAQPVPSAGSNGQDDPPIEGSNGHGNEPIESSNGHSTGPVESSNHPEDPAPATTSATPGASDVAAHRPASPVWLGADGKPLPFSDVEEVLVFLAKAKVLENHKISTGVTLPRKLLLEHKGVRAHAIFHDVAIEKRRERLHGGKVVNFFRDHHANNVAAFELSRILGMTNVPPVVIRKIGRDTGSVQLWIENSKTEADRRRLGLDPEGDWRLTSKDMLVFDNLINNIDRNQGNILYDGNFNLWFIDHTRTFGRIKELPSGPRVRRISRPLYQALQDLDEAVLEQRLRPHIGIYEIRGLLARRDLLVDLIDERIAATSELAVIFDYGDPTNAGDSEPDPDIPEAPPEPPV